jgi:hypothetical protein
MRSIQKRVLTTITATLPVVFSVSAQAQVVPSETTPTSELKPDPACVEAVEARYAPKIQSAVDSWYTANKDVLSYLEGKTGITLLSVNKDPGAVETPRTSYDFLFQVDWNLTELHNQAGSIGSIVKAGVEIPGDKVWERFTNAEDSFAILYEDLSSAYKKEEKDCYPGTFTVNLPSSSREISPRDQLIDPDTEKLVRDGCGKTDDYIDGDDPIRTGKWTPTALESTLIEKARRVPDENLVSEIKLFYSVISDSSTYADLGRLMVDHFVGGSKKILLHTPTSVLANELQRTEKFQKELERVKEEIQKQLENQASNKSLNVEQLNVPIKKLQLRDTRVLNALIGAFQGGNLQIDNFTIEGLDNVTSNVARINPAQEKLIKYKGKLRFSYCDVYGVGRDDIPVAAPLIAAEGYLPNAINVFADIVLRNINLVPTNNMWVLQHERTAKSFKNIVEVEVPFEGNLIIPVGIGRVQFIPGESGSGCAGGEGC